MSMIKRFTFTPKLGRIPSVAYKDAATSVAIILFFSSLPVLAASLVSIFKLPSGQEIMFWAPVWQNLVNGEPLIYASSYLAPVFYTLYLYNKNKESFPYFIIFLVGSIILLFVSLTIFIMVRAKDHINGDILYATTVLTYITSVVLWYFATVFEKALDRFRLDTKQGERDLSRKLSNFNGEA